MEQRSAASQPATAAVANASGVLPNATTTTAPAADSGVKQEMPPQPHHMLARGVDGDLSPAEQCQDVRQSRRVVVYACLSWLRVSMTFPAACCFLTIDYS